MGKVNCLPASLFYLLQPVFYSLHAYTINPNEDYNTRMTVRLCKWMHLLPATVPYS
jgi:hypothetical protein